jgi:hypothetical protein
VLHAALRFAVLESFKDEFKAKTFCVLRPQSRRNWVRKQVLAAREQLVGVEVTVVEFDDAIECVE